MVFISISDSVLFFMKPLPCPQYFQAGSVMNQEQPHNSDGAGSKAAGVSLLQIVGSICASFFGVQSSKNRERDFKSGKAGQFIAVGIAMTAVWYLGIYLVVTLVLEQAR